ncbi:MAG: YqhA family protein [Thiotrichaceae bacterium]
MKVIEIIFEKLLWNSRLMVIAAVVASLASAVAIMYVATVDAWQMISHLYEYASLTGEAKLELRTATVTHVVEVIDGYLLATVLIIFSLGLYELFISKIDDAENSDTASKILVIHSLDDLKNRLAKVILMILIVKFFEYANQLKFETALDLLYLAAGIALLGLALYLSHAGESHDKKH